MFCKYFGIKKKNRSRVCVYIGWSVQGPEMKTVCHLTERTSVPDKHRHRFTQFCPIWRLVGALPRADFPSLLPNQNTRIVFHLRNCTQADLIAQKREKKGVQRAVRGRRGFYHEPSRSPFEREGGKWKFD